MPATLTVNTTLDVLGHANGTLSLRQAILDASTRTTADTIVVPAGTYTLTRTGQESVDGLIGDLDIIASSTSNPLTISGAGAGMTIIDGAGINRVFDIFGGSVSIAGLTIEGGNAAQSVGGGIASQRATLTVSDCIFSGNTASGPGGGAISTWYGTLTVTNCTFSGNSAHPALHKQFYVSNGGAIFSLSGTVTVNNSTFSGNSADAYGGAIYNNGTLTVSNSNFSGNSAHDGGGIANMGGPFTMSVSDCTFSGNSAARYGGGIANYGKLTLRGCTVKGNTAPSGADLYGTASLSDTTIGDTYYP